jgi:hypothetical protein
VNYLNKARLIYLMVMACLVVYFAAGVISGLGMHEGDL